MNGVSLNAPAGNTGDGRGARSRVGLGAGRRWGRTEGSWLAVRSCKFIAT